MKREVEKTFLMGVLQRVISRHFNISKEDLFITKRKEVVTARHIFHYFAHKKLGITQANVGEYSNRDHSTVLNSCKNIKHWLERDKDIQIHVAQINKKYNTLNQTTNRSKLKWFAISNLFLQFIEDVKIILKSDY